MKSDISLVIDKFSSLDKLQVLENIHKDGIFVLTYANDKKVDLVESDLDVEYGPKEGYIMTESEDTLLLINASRNNQLMIKGMIRDLSRNLQQLRKELGFNPTDILQCAYISNVDENEIRQLEECIKDIKDLVRVKSVKFSNMAMEGLDYKNIEINGKEIKISII